MLVTAYISSQADSASASLVYPVILIRCVLFLYCHVSTIVHHLTTSAMFLRRVEGTWIEDIFLHRDIS